MSRKLKSVLLCGVSVTLVAGVTGAVFIIGAPRESSSPMAQITTGSHVDKNRRNLFLQPEALRVARQLGKRFHPESRASLVMAGNLNVSGMAQAATIVRRQTYNGEIVELLMPDRSLTWNAEQGTKAGAIAATDAERFTCERLIYDSPDYFVLAQLRGASYFTVARNVRPPDAPDNYEGPLWTVVRVDEPPMPETIRPQSSWRLYYINSQTGFIDRVVSQIDGQSVEAEISAWIENSGEQTPSHITWSIGGRQVMSYQLTSISYSK